MGTNMPNNESIAIRNEELRPTTVADIREHVNLIQRVMKSVMKKDTHYGTIPGTDKPTLYKPGAEILFATFRIAVDPTIEDLGDDEHARFRVVSRATSSTGTHLGSAVGECSSEEEKYCWRAAVCQEEFDATPENKRRKKWRRGRDGVYSIDQVRTNVADVRNTVLKMGVKRSEVALALQVMACSDIFAQDLEDIPDFIREQESGSGESGGNERAQAAGRKPANGGAVISEAQGGRLVAIARKAGAERNDVLAYLDTLGISSIDEIPRSKYDAIVKHFEGSAAGAAATPPKPGAPF